MRYVFVREYNPAYDSYLFEYFQAGGIRVDEELTIERARRMRKTLEEKPSLKSEEKLFCDYVSVWNEHPESRPSLYYLFNKIPANAGEPSERRLAELESRLEGGRARLLFSLDDVVEEIQAFYRRRLKDTLQGEIRAGAPGMQLARFFVSGEVDRLPDSRVHGLEKVEEAIQRTAREVEAWLERVSPGGIRKDIEHVIEEHSNYPPHMRRSRYLDSCEHKSEYVRLAVHRDIRDDSESMFLLPVRGFGAVEKYHWDVLFPKYYVLEPKVARKHPLNS